MDFVRVLFYKAGKDRTIIDNLISGYTGIFNPGTGPYAHTEIWWPDEDGNYENGECYTSSMRDGGVGTIVRPASEVLTHPERWDFAEIVISRERELSRLATAIELARGEVANNKGYDKLCILSFFLPFRVHSSHKQICSEAVQTFLFNCGVFTRIEVLSPRRLSSRLTDMGYRLKPLSTEAPYSALVTP